jgi:hypothetical protein
MSEHASTDNFHFLAFLIDGGCGKVAFLLIHFNDKIAFCRKGYDLGWKVGALVLSNFIESVIEEEEAGRFLCEVDLANCGVIAELLEELLVVEGLFGRAFFEIVGFVVEEESE